VGLKNQPHQIYADYYWLSERSLYRFLIVDKELS